MHGFTNVSVLRALSALRVRSLRESSRSTFLQSESGKSRFTGFTSHAEGRASYGLSITPDRTRKTPAFNGTKCEGKMLGQQDVIRPQTRLTFALVNTTRTHLKETVVRPEPYGRMYGLA